ncbi:MAG: Glu-tRNA(Gln) amidotransferase subunit GatE [Candidatus Saliniplasma sp.]
MEKRKRNYDELGLKVGLEIHQQLDTKKLFCDCPSELVEDFDHEITRELRPTASEMGEVDAAALMEAQKDLRFRYQAPEISSCLVEMDEEPPEGPDNEALDIALKMALMLESDIVDEIQFMRKIVIDGSNTTGFQRTSLIAVEGEVEVEGKTISIPSICLEEDAARSIGKEGKEKVYRLDRLGIPLIEMATGPDMNTPEEAKEVAQMLGGLLRATRQVKRGLGTIREDLNVSIQKGARVEMKGVQDLSMLPEYVENEIDRQLRLIKIAGKLKDRDTEVDRKFYDVSDLFEKTDSGIIKGSMNSGKNVYAIKLTGFHGTLRGKDGEPLLGPEMADYAKKAGVKGIFHSDELPKFGITQEEVDSIISELELGKNDAFALVAAKEDTANDALEKVAERAEMALDGVPEETRRAEVDGSSTFLRPLSGEARMYPETDIPPISVSQDRLNGLEGDLPERPSERIKRFQDDYGINKQQSEQLFRKGYDILFEDIVKEHGNPSTVANTFLHTYPELEREDFELEKISDEQLFNIFEMLDAGEFAKEGISDILKEMTTGKNVEEAMESAGLEKVYEEDVRGAVIKVLDDREDFVEERGMSALGPLMGVIMKELRGKADGEKVSKILKEELQKRIN